MRIWTIHPILLDNIGLIAAWRETLLAIAVLEGKTKGYRNHPQLIRFKHNPRLIHNYALGIAVEILERGMKPDLTKINPQPINYLDLIPVTKGQLKFEIEHITNKIKTRKREAKGYYVAEAWNTPVHPLFHIIEGEVEPWERL